jgi:predicted esterase
MTAFENSRRFADRVSSRVSRAAAFVNLPAGFYAAVSLAACVSLEPAANPGALEESPANVDTTTAPIAEEAPPRALEAIDLEVPGFRPAVVVLPADRSAPRPVLIAAHGAGDGPRWQCEVWSSIVAGRGFVLCPRGLPLATGVDEPGHFFRDHHYLGRLVTAALAALRQHHGALVDPGPVVYTGYSQGAAMGALFANRRPEMFPRMVLIEGGHREWDVATARAFRRGGGARVLFACGGGYCANSARKAERWLKRAGVEARVEHIEGGGHTYGSPVAERVAAAFDWVVEGDARWK